MFPPELADYTEEQLDAWVTANATTVNSATARRALADYKLASAIAWITDWLDDNPDQKLIVFAVHRHVLQAIYNTLEQRRHHPVLLHGGTLPQHRPALIEQFQTLKANRVFVGQLVAAGESITLHAASTVVFVETDWSHTAIAQAMSRAHRRGQNEAVLGHLLIVPNSMDERIHAIALRKARGVTALWGGIPNAGSVDHSVREHGGVAAGVGVSAG
jgi:SNF2 family DNA or RNA helicase